MSRRTKAERDAAYTSLRTVIMDNPVKTHTFPEEILVSEIDRLRADLDDAEREIAELKEADSRRRALEDD